MILSDESVRAIAASWDGLALEQGSPFHASWFLDAFAREWRGVRHPRHVLIGRAGDRVDAILPAYLYESCPRLDYYRGASADLPDGTPLLVSHALVGWYGGVAGRSDGARRAAIEAVLAEARAAGAVTMIAGIDARDSTQTSLLRLLGFEVGRWHTLMVRALAGLPDDPTSALPKRQRTRVRNSLSQARRAGTVVREGTRDEIDAVVALVTGSRRHHPFDDDLLPPRFLRAVLAAAPSAVDVLLAVDGAGTPLGAHVSFAWGARYLMWAAGHDAETLDRHRPSHLLYEASIERARRLDCSEIQAGRAMYAVKRQHGFEPVPLHAAVRGTGAAQHEAAGAWLRALGERHLARYGNELGEPQGLKAR